MVVSIMFNSLLNLIKLMPVSESTMNASLTDSSLKVSVEFPNRPGRLDCRISDRITRVFDNHVSANIVYFSAYAL